MQSRAPQEAEDSYFRQLDAALKAKFRAIGGEPCLVCGEPIPAGAHWKDRDRHVCSPACNHKLVRRYKSKVTRGLAPAFGADARELSEAKKESARAPRYFATDPDAEFPYEHARWPIAGDVVERHGVETAYVPIEMAPSRADKDTAALIAACIKNGRVSPLAAVHLQSGAWTAIFLDVNGRPNRTELGRFVHRGRSYVAERRPNSLDVIGLSGINLGHEIISDVDNDGLSYRWRAPLFSPIWWLRLETPEWVKASESRRRATASRSAYLARMRARGDLTAEAEYIDPKEVFDAARWICGICGNAIDRARRWPDPWSVTLDHIRPVSHSGEHSRDNLQPAHWICNVIKGNSESHLDSESLHMTDERVPTINRELI
jgi:5-methylcytosine-specific restriction endonuclease McrA